MSLVAWILAAMAIMTLFLFDVILRLTAF